MEYSENYNLLTRGDQAGFTFFRHIIWSAPLSLRTGFLHRPMAHLTISRWWLSIKNAPERGV